MDTIIAKIRQQAMDRDICYIEDKQAYQFISELHGEALGSFKTGHEMAKCLLQQARINGAVHIIGHLELVCYLVAVGNAAKMYVTNDPEKLHEFIRLHPLQPGNGRVLETLRQLTERRASEDAIIAGNRFVNNSHPACQ